MSEPSVPPDPIRLPGPGSTPGAWKEARVRRFRALLLDFFDLRRRDLPWRDVDDPYPVLVSEVMLQQTRVEAVVPYFRRWMERFPDLETLAAAGQQEVLRLWQGLGYYSRARNLHRTARELVRERGGSVPSDPGRLRSLPGIGPYTAGAVASIAFRVPVPAVDGNVRRVLARLADDPAPGRKDLERWAAALVDPDRPGAFNQALMELGSRVCTPRGPRCEACPVAAFCAARAAGTQEETPRPRHRGRPPLHEEAVAVLVRRRGRGRVLLRRRPEEGLLGGMWELPGRRVKEGRGPGEEAEALARDLVPGDPGKPRALPPLDHAFSHRRVRYRPFLFLRVWEPDGSDGETRGGAADGSGSDPGDSARWVGWSELDELPIPAAQRRLLERVPGDDPPG